MTESIDDKVKEVQITEENFLDELETNYSSAIKQANNWYRKAQSFLNMRQEINRLINRRNILEFYQIDNGSVGYRVVGRKQQIGFNQGRGGPYA